MYLKSLAIENFRKFGTKNNVISFAAAKDYKTDDQVNIAPKTTLIVGKNNSGKTTVVESLKRLLSPSSFHATDFNFAYLKSLLKRYTPTRINSGKIESPSMTFILTVGLDANDPDLLTNIVPFITLGDVGESEIIIKAVWEPEDNTVFLQALKRFLVNKKQYKDQLFIHFLEFLDNQKYRLSFYNRNDSRCEDFQLRKLVELESIAANTITSDDCLSVAFAKIVDYRYQQLKQSVPFDNLDKEILAINSKLTSYFMQEHGNPVNDSLSKIFSSDKCQVLLRSDLTFQKLLRTVLKYEYVEGNNQIPENQFGLGYTNLMMIVASIISYMEKFPESSFNSQINLISIEEPETFMHPQMQELFIRDINKMIGELLEGHNKHVNSQIIITTHSAHILNSKIHEGNSFNCINYITSIDQQACSVNMSDTTILPKEDTQTEEDHAEMLRYIKKHITFGVSQLFFADAAIFVEGITEYTLLQHYLTNRPELNKKYISLIMINGAFSHVYRHLISSLQIPVLIITDIDFKRSDEEKGNRTQMTAPLLANRVTTNQALIKYYETDSVEQILNASPKREGNMMIVCQKHEISSFYATSFEEAFILKNPTNTITNKTIEDLLPKVYDESVKDGGLSAHSYRIQYSLTSKKSDFANKLLYRIISDEHGTLTPDLPEYIEDGLSFLSQELGEI